MNNNQTYSNSPIFLKIHMNNFNTSQFVYYPIDNKYIDSSISFPEENDGNNIFINHFSYSNALYESMNQNFIIPLLIKVVIILNQKMKR